MKILPILLKDGYKADHRSQYPEGTETVYSNMTARGSRIPGTEYVIVFGINYLLQRYLVNLFNDEFFSKDKDVVIEEYAEVMGNYVGLKDVSHIGDLHDLGHLPIKIKSLAEGTKCPLRVPFMTIVNTDKRFFWLTNMLETLISTVMWHPMTSATTADSFRKLFEEYNMSTIGNIDFVPFQGHDFSMRGVAGIEAAIVSAGAHLTSFKGSDTVPAIPFLKEYYGAKDEFIACSVSATEHSVMCLGEKESEIETFKRLINEIYPVGIVSIVSDTWDFWKVITEFLPTLKEDIMARDGKVVIRPDSGDPVKIICGDHKAPIDSPQWKGLIQCLAETFGVTMNSKGYMELDSHIGAIYGDSITYDRAEKILKLLKEKGFASNNIVFGIGSYTYQYVTRDTHNFAVKATMGVVDGEMREIFKDPKTDDGMKKSAKGLLHVTKDLKLIDQCTEDQESEGELEVVFLNGKIINQSTLGEIRDRIKNE